MKWDEKTAKTVCDFVKGSLIADSAEQRVNAAKTVLEQTDGKCGVAWLVLGREGAQSLEEAEDFLQKAFELLRQEENSEEQNFGYLVERRAYGFAVADLAPVMWSLGKQEEAEKLVQSCFEEIRAEAYYDVCSTLRALAVSFLLQRGKAQQAQALLFSDTEDDAEWNYLNALVHYAISGDCLISRSALALAFTHGNMTAERLLTGDTSISDPTVDDFGLSRYIADTGPAWHSTAGALEWLQRILNGPMSGIRETHWQSLLNTEIKLDGSVGKIRWKEQTITSCKAMRAKPRSCTKVPCERRSGSITLPVHLTIQ